MCKYFLIPSVWSFHRARFESLCLSLFQQTLKTIDRVLAKSNITKDNVDQVLLAIRLAFSLLQTFLTEFLLPTTNQENFSYLVL